MLTKDGGGGGGSGGGDNKPRVKRKKSEKSVFRGVKCAYETPHTPLPQIHIYRRRRRWAISWLGYFRNNNISKIPVHKDRIKRGT